MRYASPKRVEAVLDRLAADDVALLDRPVADDLLGCEDGVAGDGDVAEGVDRAFLDRDDDLDARLLRVLPIVDDLRLAERDVRSSRSPGRSS